MTRGGEADVWGPPNKAEEGGEEERGGAAMADKPSRGLVLYAAGHAALLPPASGGGGGAGGGGGGSHLDAFASLASCGFLSLRSPPLASGEEKRDSTILELAQLLDVYDDLFPAKTEKTGQETAQVEDRKSVV